MITNKATGGNDGECTVAANDDNDDDAANYDEGGGYSYAILEVNDQIGLVVLIFLSCLW